MRETVVDFGRRPKSATVSLISLLLLVGQRSDDGLVGRGGHRADGKIRPLGEAVVEISIRPLGGVSCCIGSAFAELVVAS